MHAIPGAYLLIFQIADDFCSTFEHAAHGVNPKSSHPKAVTDQWPLLAVT
jgi:hypothetical protein